MAVSSQLKNTMIWSGIFFNIPTLKNEMEAKENGRPKIHGSRSCCDPDRCFW